MSVTLTLEATRIQCQQCQFILEDGDELEPAYECGTCGDINDERRCDSCNRFKAKAEGGICPSCLDYNEYVEHVPVITCTCHDEEHAVYS